MKILLRPIDRYAQTVKIGYVIASHEVTKRGKKVGYLYREQPDNDQDSGWRVFSGEETQEYTDNAENFSMYNASTIVEIDPDIAPLLVHEYPIAFERNTKSCQFVEIDESELN